jgi:hypothetical protein
MKYILIIIGLLLAGAVVGQIRLTASVQENECNKCLKTCEELCQ